MEEQMQEEIDRLRANRLRKTIDPEALAEKLADIAAKIAWLDGDTYWEIRATFAAVLREAVGEVK